MNKTIRLLVLATCVLGLIGIVAIAPAFSAINVVAASPELADITKQVGGNLVSVYSIAKPNQDYHMLEPRPSDVSRIGRADMVVQIGLDLDMWMDALMNAAGNGRVNKGVLGYVDASIGVHLMEVPNKQITGASGDIHVYGNPHYFYDPENGKIMAHNILIGLNRISPSHRSTFESNYQRFAAEIDRRTAAWQRKLRPYKGRPVVIYHDSAVYFIRRFGLRLFGELEPKPGIPPTANHVRDLIGRMKEANVKAVVVESIYPSRYPDMVARETGAKSERVPYSVGAMGAKDYFGLIDGWVQGYKAALR